MIRVLVKKQMMEVWASLYQNQKNGKRRSVVGIIGYGLFMLFITLFLAAMFFRLGTFCAGVFSYIDMGWFYYLLMGMLSIILSVFGSVFNTYSTVYLAKDNELLLSMPLKPQEIMTARLGGVYLTALYYELLSFIPAAVAYMIADGFTASNIIGAIAALIAISIFVLILSCILGYGVAVISQKLKSKAIITVIIALVFFAAYYYVYFKAAAYLNDFLKNAAAIGAEIKEKAEVLYVIGSCATGNVSSMCLVLGVTIVIMLVVYKIMVNNYTKIMTTNKGEKKVAYNEKTVKSSSVATALYKKELARFTRSASYMLNCGLGVLFLVVVGATAIIKPDIIREFTSLTGGSEEGKQMISLIMTSVLCFFVSMSDIAAPSVSMEGKCFWILRSLPVSTWQIIKAKCSVQIRLTLVAGLFASVFLGREAGLEGFNYAFMILATAFFAILITFFGMTFGILLPNFNWTSEQAALKQSANAFIALFGGMAFVAAFGGIIYFLNKVIEMKMVMVACLVLEVVVAAGFYCWLKTIGVKKLENLG
ncbi:ABC-2 type transport system permease protein [Acetitomaculum ruminis DSM 5522]|uniref:ABC-2 type transport system permease protein n=1 Tax=Acetitomaculum ruminis DSM 5522 TaxID=1120918 RepID=A0A1I0YEH0_9FIRM|nr:hypothetical protein [Acetitomaculum ruminis]SFB11187.1 ABC-2 type transport system permease protein [Acetitomaculum ruminis DSM 5522]